MTFVFTRVAPAPLLFFRIPNFSTNRYRTGTKSERPIVLSKYAGIMTDKAIDNSAEPKSETRDPAIFDWLLEAAILFGLAYVIEPIILVWAADFDIAFQASIYWVPVILLAVHYGLASGLVAALVATCLFFLADPADVMVGETLLASSLRIGMQPLGWTAAAAVLGAMRSHSLEVETRLRANLATETRTVEILGDRYIRLRDRVESLERALAVGTPPTLRQTGQDLTALGGLPAPACCDRLYEILRSGANGAQISLFVISGGETIALARTQAGTQRADLPPAAVFYIRDSRGQAMVKVHIDHIDPGQFTQADQTYFAGLCDRIGDVLAQRGIRDIVDLARSREVA